MAKILLISIHFPPFNVVASERAKSFANHLNVHHEVHVLTADWVKRGKGQHFQIDEGDGYDELIEEGIRLYRIKTPEIEMDGSMGKARVLFNYMKGRFDGPSTRTIEKAFNDAAFSICERHTFDFTLAIFSPFHHLKTAYRIHQRFEIPYAIDFRDLYNNRYLQDEKTVPFKEKIRDWFVKKKVARWTSNALFCTSVSESISANIENLTQVKTHTITNGFESGDFEYLSPHRFDSFTVVHSGSVYNNQNHEIFLEGFAKFCEQNSDAKMLFIGADLPGHTDIPTGRIPNFKHKVAQFLSVENFEITPRVDRKKALSLMMAADALYFPSFPNSTGTYSGKFFEYLGSKKPFLICPNDHGVVENASKLTQSGVICDSSEEVRKVLSNLAYGNYVSPSINENELQKFSRRAQASKLLSLINDSFIE